MRFNRTRSLGLALVVAAVCLTVPLGFAPATATASAAGADDGAHIVGTTQLDTRTVDLLIDSPALGGTAPVRLLLPAHYTSEPTRLFPQLWLLHGCCADKDATPTPDYLGWADHTDVEQFTADKDVMVVLPAGGYAGFYSMWQSGRPDWETFHTNEVRQLIERNYRVSQTRAIAGLSIGGYGAMAYAFRHPGMFQGAASYSGIPNTLMPSAAQWVQLILVREGFGVLDLWGSDWWNRDVWSAHNPYDHVAALRGIALYVSAGNGQPGPLDHNTSADPIEMAADASSQTFTDLLRRNGIPVTVDYYGNGVHAWPYWERELHTSWPFLATALGV